MESVWQKQMKLQELTPLGWEDVADCFGEEIRSTAWPKWRFRQLSHYQLTSHSRTCTNNSCITYGVTWYQPWNIANTARDVSTRKESYDGRFREAKAKQMHHDWFTQCLAQYVTNEEIKACWTHKLWPMHIASLANHHIEIPLGWGNSDARSIARRIDEEIAMFKGISVWEVIGVSILLRVSNFLVSVIKISELLIRLSMCKCHMPLAKVLDSKSGCKMTSKLDIILPDCVMWDRNN